MSKVVSTCFVGIPSDRILFPSERGDKTSFFQYMNPWSLTAYSVSKLGAWIQEKTRRWASELVPSVPCMDSGVSCAQFLVLFLTRNVFSLSLKKQKNAAVRDDLTTDTNYKSSEATRRRGVALLRREPYLEQKRFLPFPPVSPSLSTFGKELEYRK